MTIEVKVPLLPESVADATIVTWHKQVGDFVNRDENLVDLETDKVVLEVPAPDSGVIAEIRKTAGTSVVAQEILAVINPKAAGATATPAQASQSQPTAQAAPSTSTSSAASASTSSAASTSTQAAHATAADLSPSVRRLVGEHGINVNQIAGTGKNGRVTKEDVERFVTTPISQAPAAQKSTQISMPAGQRLEKRVPMSRLRARVAERLVMAQHSAAMLTTFNEVNLQAVMQLRNQYKDQFEKRHGVRLGFMSFFTKAVIEALKRFPAVNASIDGQDIIYHDYYDIGIAVSTDRGLVVPILRDADQMGMAEIEKAIGEFANRARDGKLTIEEMTGGTFTITNGGVFGSLLATPILNPPQVGILGMHKIEERPIVENGQVVIRPMMYLALTYDHRIIDGKESVQFLVTVKQMLEDPARLLLDI